MFATRNRSRQFGAMLTLVWFLTATFVAVLGPTQAALAATNPFTQGTTGFDISYPNCGISNLPPASNGATYRFGIVGVTGGRAFSTNSCLAQEYALVAGSPLTLSLYMNLNYPIGTTASKGNSGPAGNCTHSDKACQAYNYGYNAAQNAYGYASQNNAFASTWWLDVETVNSWSSKASLNVRVIQGAVDYLQNVAHVQVGIYSTASMWNRITGSATLGLPIWVAGAAELSRTACQSAKGFNGGPIWLIQHVNGSFDEDFAC